MEVFMNLKKFFGASLLVFITFQITNFLGHSLWLGQTYQSLASIWRPDMADKMWIFTVIGIFTSILFVYIFKKGYEGKGAIEGLRFGLIMGLFVSIPASFCEYAMYSIPLNLAIKWFFLYMAQYILCGLVVAKVAACQGKCCCGSNKE
jgi:hypothetical protein